MAFSLVILLFIRGFRVSNVFYLIKPPLKDNLSVNFSSSLVLELADDVLASNVSSFSAPSFHNSMLHLIRQRWDVSPPVYCQGAFLQHVLIGGAASQHAPVYVPAEGSMPSVPQFLRELVTQSPNLDI